MNIKRWAWIAVIVVAVVLIGKFFLLDTAATPNGVYQIDLEALHRVAISNGTLPDRIEVEKIADFAFPRTMGVAGGGFRLQPMVLLSHRVVGPSGSVIIDTAMGEKAGSSMPGGKFDAAAFDRMQAAMKQAQAIVFTHEHPDHVGGVASAPDFASIAGKVQMTKEQLGSAKLVRDDFPSGTLSQLHALEYDGLHLVAPGVVLQKAPGHSPGSQLIYVELANGARYLFVGDVAWSTDNITEQVGRPRLAGLILSEDRGAVAAQLRALEMLPKDVHVVIAHDPVSWVADVKAGLFHQGFTPTTEAASQAAK